MINLAQIWAYHGIVCIEGHQSSRWMKSKSDSVRFVGSEVDTDPTFGITSAKWMLIRKYMISLYIYWCRSRLRNLLISLGSWVMPMNEAIVDAYGDWTSLVNDKYSWLLLREWDFCSENSKYNCDVLRRNLWVWWQSLEGPKTIKYDELVIVRTLFTHFGHSDCGWFPCWSSDDLLLLAELGTEITQWLFHRILIDPHYSYIIKDHLYRKHEQSRLQIWLNYLSAYMQKIYCLDCILMKLFLI